MTRTTPPAYGRRLVEPRTAAPTTPSLAGGAGGAGPGATTAAAAGPGVAVGAGPGAMTSAAAVLGWSGEERQRANARKGLRVCVRPADKALRPPAEAVFSFLRLERDGLGPRLVRPLAVVEVLHR